MDTADVCVCECVCVFTGRIVRQIGETGDRVLRRAKSCFNDKVLDLDLETLS